VQLQRLRLADDVPSLSQMRRLLGECTPNFKEDDRLQNSRYGNKVVVLDKGVTGRGVSITAFPEKTCENCVEDRFAMAFAECRAMQVKTQDLQVKCTEARCRSVEAEQELLNSRAVEVEHVNYLWQLGHDISNKLRHETSQAAALRGDLAEARVQLKSQQEQLVQAHAIGANQLQRMEAQKKRIAELQGVLHDAQTMLVNAKETEDQHAHQHEFSQMRIAELEQELNEALVAGLNNEMELLRDVEAKTCSARTSQMSPLHVGE